MHIRCLLVIALAVGCGDKKQPAEQPAAEQPEEATPAEAPEPVEPAEPAEPAADDPRGAALLDGFPVPDGAERDPGYPPKPGPLEERLFVASDRAPADVAKWLPDAAQTAGWRCADMQGGSFVCYRDGESRQISARAIEHPQGGTAYFLGVLPGS